MSNKEPFKPTFYYSGLNSEKFWEIVDTLKVSDKKQRKIYCMGCKLQDLEEKVLKKLTKYLNPIPENIWPSSEPLPKDLQEWAGKLVASNKKAVIGVDPSLTCLCYEKNGKQIVIDNPIDNPSVLNNKKYVKERKSK